MKYIACMGGIWRLTERSYTALCRDIRVGKPVDLDNYGKMILSDPEDLEDLRQKIQDELDEEARRG